MQYGRASDETKKAVLALAITALLTGPLTYIMLYRVPVIGYHVPEGPHHLVWVIGVPLIAALLVYRIAIQRIIVFVALIPVTLILVLIFFFGVFGLDY
jgi:hypothetical protein